MKYKKIMLILITAIFLASIAGACASDVNDTLLASEDTDVTEISQIDEISADDDSQLIGQCSEKTIREGNAGTFQELQDSINSTESGKTLTLEKNYGYDDNFGGDGIIIDKSITIEGNGHVIGGAKQGRIFFINAAEKIVLNNITFKNGYAGSGAAGGAIVFNNTNDVVVSNCIFENCKAYDAGAILFNSSGNCSVSGCAFLNNSAEFHGGAIASEMTGIYIFDSTFDGNNALAGGGTIFMKEFSAGNSVIDGCLIYNSYVGASNDKQGGGAILIGKGGNSKITVSNSAITNSTTAEGPGGTISVLAGDCSLINLTVQNSSAQNDDGGAIYWKGSNGYLVNISIFDASANSAGSGKSSNGGAIFYDGTRGTLINASISNTFAAGNGGAIYWKGSSPVAINNVSITHSRTEVTGPTNSADGGAIYSTTITQFDNVYISDAHARKNQGDVYGGAIYCKDGQTFNNITVIASGASTDNGTSYGGAVYSQRQFGSTSVSVYNSTFEQNNADMGGGLYFEKLAGKIYGSSFAGNVADSDGGAVYANKEGMEARSSVFEYNSAKNGGAIFAQNAQVVIRDSTLEFNTAEEKGGALYYNYIDKATPSQIIGTDLVNNTAFQGSAIYGTKFNKFSLIDSVLLDNRANSSGFIEKTAGVDGEGHTYVSGVFVGFDNLANAIWQEATVALACSNVTYWGVGGKKTANSPPDQSDREANINVTVEIYDENGVKLSTANVVTDKNGEFKHTFDGEDGKTYHFAFVHDGDGYYADLRDTLSNGSHVKIYANASVYYSQNQSFLIELTDGAWENMNGTVSVTFNDSEHTTFTVDVINGIGVKSNCTYLPAGHYNATASFAGDANHTGDSDWVLFEVLPYYDLHITKEVNVTTDTANVKDIINYTITVTNHGPGKAYGVNVTEILSLSLKLIESNLTAGNYNSSEGYWYIGELDVGHFETLTIIAEIIHMGEIDNTVWVTGLGKDANEANNVDSAHNFTAMAVVDLSVNKTCDKDEYCIGDIAVWTITVCNAGNGTDAANVTLYDYFPGDYFEIINITVDSGTYAEQIKNSYYLWDIGFMANGTNASMVITSRALQEREDILNFASIFSSEDEWDYDNNVARKTADVIKPYSTVNVTGVVLNYGESTNVTVTAEGATGITAKINDADVAVVDNFTIPISGLAAGNYTLTVTTIPDGDHNPVSKTVNITVNKASTEIILENETMNLEVTDIVSSGAALNPSVAGNLTYTSGNSSVVKIEDDNIIAVGQGQTTVIVSFNGNENYTAAENRTITVTVSLKDASVSVNNSTLDLFVDDTFTIVATTTPAGLNVTFVPDNSGVYSVDENGFVTALMEGTGSILVKVGGDGVYAENSTNVTVTVSKIPTEIIIANATLDVKVLNFTLAGATLNPADAGNLTYNSSNSSVAMVEYGVIIPVGPGQAIITVSFNGTDKYAAAENMTITVNVDLNNLIVTVDNATLDLKVGETYAINATTVPAIAKMFNITYTSNNESVVIVDKNGTVTAMGEGNAIITVDAGDGRVFAKNSTTVTVTVSKWDANVVVSMPENVVIGDNPTVNVRLPSDATGNVTFSVDGSIVATVNLTNGTANFTLSNLGVGGHSINVTYSGDDRYVPGVNKTSLTVNKMATKLTAEKVTATYNVKKNLIVTLKDAKGNALSGVKVTVKIKTAKDYTTDNNGQVKVNVAKLVPKKCTAKVSFAGNANYHASSAEAQVTVKKAKPKMTAKNKSFKKSKKVKKYTITLKNNKGKPIKKAKVTLKVKGKTYKATTNSKGKAVFKIKNLKKKGKYTAFIKFKGNKYYNKATKKAKIKVIVTFKTVSKGSKDKATVKEIQQALKDHGYYLTYKGQYLKIDGIYHGCTERSIKEFQKDKGLKVTGKVDEKTAKKLGIL